MEGKMMSFTERCILWNSQRYDQKYDYNLAVSLLLEEVEELFSTTKPVERLDAIGDIVFVACGVFWKLGFNNVQVEAMFYSIDLETCTAREAYEWSKRIEYEALDIIDEMEGAYPGLSLALSSAFDVALGALRGMGLQDQFYHVMHAICDSNATKEIKGKSDPTVKANVVKGSGFIPPTEELTRIYNTLWASKKEGSVQ